MNNITSFYIAGVAFVTQPLLENLKNGDILTLQHEPDNPYDENAIKIFKDNDTIGYVPKNKTKELHCYRLSSIPLLTTLVNYIPEMPTYKRILVTVQSDIECPRYIENNEENQSKQFLPYERTKNS